MSWVYLTDLEGNVTPTRTLKTNEQIVSEVLQGKWGNGTERYERLTKAGYNYEIIQGIINRTQNLKSNIQIAQEVIQGKWGNGAERFKKLRTQGYDPDVIQGLVNELLKK